MGKQFGGAALSEGAKIVTFRFLAINSGHLKAFSMRASYQVFLADRLFSN